MEEPRIFGRNVESAMYSYANGVVARSSADDIDGKSDDNDDDDDEDDENLDNGRCDKQSLSTFTV